MNIQEIIHQFELDLLNRQFERIEATLEVQGRITNNK